MWYNVSSDQRSVFVAVRKEGKRNEKGKRKRKGAVAW